MAVGILKFNKEELIGVSIILFLIFLVTGINLRISIRRSRDSQRKADIRAISNALDRYQNDFGFFPFSSPEGEILGCRAKLDELGFPVFERCVWGQDALKDPSDPDFPAYIQILPIDPQNKQEVSYLYASNSKRYQIFASLESKNEDEYNSVIEARGLNCGTRVCNFGLSHSNTPLDKSIQEYENELLEKKEK